MGKAAKCIPVARIPAHAGPSQATDALPVALTQDPAALLAYRVKILNANGRSAGPSAPAFAAAGAAPPPVEHLQASPVREGAMLEWQQQPTQSIVELDRILMQTKVPHKASTGQPSKPAASIPPEVYLQTSKLSSDTGGVIDPTAQWGETYRYTAQRVRSVTLDGYILGLRSAVSPAVTVTLRDTFPPAVPRALAAIPEADPHNHSIDLSWEPVPDTDVSGYFVYRQQVDTSGNPAGRATRLNLTPAVGPAYNDRTAVPGQSYLYRVTAIDTSGNESAPSAGVEETVPEL
jgi:hypothetical protein